MKVIILALLAATVSTTKIYTTLDKEVTNGEKWWGNDYEKYRAALEDGDSNNCQIRESRNWKGAQQCAQSWECRGARTCERGGWCSGYDGCYQTPLPYQAPGLAPDC